ncbi:MAG: esterase [Methylococcales bacterium]|nr:esterase [Methylococcales bacterium]
MVGQTKMTLFWTLAIQLLVTGCAYDGIYRSDYNPCVVSTASECSQHSLQKHHVGTDQEFLLGFVEIDDQGQLRDRAQMRALIDSLYQIAVDDSIVINVFVHGWHHNARPGDPNIESFKGALSRLSRIEHDLSLTKHTASRKVVGVYVGWRGESITLPGINYLTFWDRKGTAQEVGHRGITELFLNLEEIANVKNALSPPIKSRLVLMGHSFGGAVVYSATSQILASRFIDTRAGKSYVDTAKGFGDLVVLLNPAFEALSYAPSYDLAQARCSYFDNQVPRLAILTSEADYATKLAFPAGQAVSTFFETHDTVERNDCNLPYSLDEGAADRSAVGHFEPLLSHTLTPLAGQTQPMAVVNYGTMKNIWSTQTKGGSTQFGSTVLTHLNKTTPRNPYLNIRVDKTLIADHNDVFGGRVMDFLRLLVEMSTTD